MEKVDFANSKGIIRELEGAVEDVKADPEVIKQAQIRITGCKHAIQVFSLCMEQARMTGKISVKLKDVQLA